MEIYFDIRLIDEAKLQLIQSWIIYVLFTIFFLYITEEIKSVYRLIDLTFINIKVERDTLLQHLLDKLILVVKIFFSFLRETNVWNLINRDNTFSVAFL